METLKAITTIIGAVAIAVAAGVAVWGINSWRRESVGRRRQEIAEEAIVAVYTVRDNIRAARSPFSSGGEGSSRRREVGESSETQEASAKQAAKDALYAPLERLNNKSDDFSALYKAQLRFVAYFGKQAETPFKSIKEARDRIYIAGDMLIRNFDAQDEITSVEKEGWRKDLMWMGEKNDELGRLVDTAVEQLESICRPVLASQKKMGFARLWPF